MSIFAKVNFSRRQFAPHSLCIIARVVFEEGEVGGVGEGGSCLGCIAKLEAAKGARSVCSCVFGGEEAGRFALLLLSPPLAFLGHQEKALARRTGGSWSWGTRHAWRNILPSFICSPSFSALLGMVLGKSRCHWSREGGRRERQRRRGEEEEEAGAEDISPAFQGHLETRACAGGQAGRVVQPVFRQGYLLSKSSWLLCPVSPGRQESRQGNGKNWMQLRLHGLGKCLSRVMQGSRV